MRILFIDFTIPYLLKDANYPVGGWAVELSNWIKGFISTNHSIGVLTWKGANQYVGKTDHYFELIETYDPKKGLKVIKYFYYYIPILLKTTKQFNPDVIIQACSGVSTGIMAFIGKILGIPFVYRVANDMDTDKRIYSRLKLYERTAFYYGLKTAKLFLCQNTYQRNNLTMKYPNICAKILYNPFDMDLMPAQIQRPQDRNYIAWLGVFSAQKNLALLLDIASDLPHVEFKIAGAPSQNLDSKTKLALEKLGELKNVHFVGYMKRAQIPSFLNGARALLSTSLYEGFSNTFLEAFAAGTPVIAPSRVDPDNILKNQDLGLTAKHEHDLKDLIIKIFSYSDSQYKKLSKRCRSYLVMQHSHEKQAAKLIDVLEQSVL